jgi:hypothetical protein
LTAFLLPFGAPGAVPPCIRQRRFAITRFIISSRPLVFETDDLEYAISAGGKNVRFKDRVSGSDYLDASDPGYFISISKNNVVIFPKIAGNLNVEFGASGISAVLHVHSRPGYLTVELISITDHNIGSIDLGRIPLTLKDHVGPTLAHCRNSQYAEAFVALNLHTRADCWKESTRGVLRAAAEARVRLPEAKFAIVGCATDVLLDRIALIEKEQSLPFPQLSHVWARKSPEIRTSYLFLDLTKYNFEDIIGYAKLGGFRYIVAYDGSWSVGQYGNYSVNLLSYPGGDSDPITVSQAIHQAGLQLGCRRGSGWNLKVA